jgi:hypothetical protein
MPSFDYETEPLDEMEDVLAVYYGGRGQVGQKYVISNRRLLIGPLDTKIAQDIDAYILNQAVAGAGLGTLMKDVLSSYRPMNSKTLWLRHVVDVRPTNNAGWFKPPGLRITTNTEETYDLGIVATPTTMSRNPKNNVVRDAAVHLIGSAVRTSRAARPLRGYADARSRPDAS